MVVEHIDVNCSVVELPPTDIEKLNSKINYTNSRINTTNKKVDNTIQSVNNVSNRVTDITPYEEIKQAYIGDTECVFTKAKDGVISANVITESGNSIAISMELLGNDIIVRFDELTELATVKISIQ